MKRMTTPVRLTPGRSILRTAGLLCCLALLTVVSFGRAATLEGRFVTRQPGWIAGAADDAAMRVVVTPLDGSGARQAAVGPDGRFVIKGLPPGRAAVVVGSERGGTPEATRIVVLSDSGRNAVTLAAQGPTAPTAPTFPFKLYRGEYYNDKSSEAAADPVTVTAPGNTGSVDFDLAAGGGTIAGRVTADVGGSPIPGLLVFALGRSSFILSFDRTDANGEYKITGVPADDFLVSINTLFFLSDNDYVGEYYNNSPTIFGATVVSVLEGQDVTGINFGLVRGGNITGRVTAEQGGAALAGVAVLAAGVQPLVVNRLVITDGNGDYNLRALPAGAYALHFQPEGGYIDEYYNNKSSEDAADPVAVTAGNATTDIDAALTTGGVIAGRVRTTGSLLPIPDVVVTASRAGQPFSYQALTGSDGRYTIDGLATGTYQVGVPELQRWYDNRDEASLADPVAVTAGQTRSNIDITATVIIGGCGVDPQSRVILSGHVRSGGQPVEDADLELYREDELSPGQGLLPVLSRSLSSTTSTDAGGAYSFDCLDIGTYYVRCVPSGTPLLSEWYSNADSVGATELTFIFGGSRSDIDFDLEPGGSLSGKITTGGSTGLGFAVVFARNTTSGEDFEGQSDAAGNYTVNSGSGGGLRSGTYKVWMEDFSTANLGLVPIALTRFEATPAPNGIALEWATASDGVVGFHVERADSPNLLPVRLTSRLLAGGHEYQYLDDTARPGITYAYWLVGVERGGQEQRFGPLTAAFGQAGATRLLGVAPNPLSASATVSFSLANPDRAHLRVFDLAGRMVRLLLDSNLPAGASSVAWDGRNESGAEAPAGVYFVRAELGGAVETRKVVVKR